MIEAIIFDMDGVLADSEPIYHLSINQVLESHGLRLSEEANKAILGTTVQHTWSWLKHRYSLDGDISQWIKEYDAVILRNLRENVVAAPGLYKFLDHLVIGGYLIGLASSSQSNWVDTVLSTLGIKDRFQVILSGDMVTNGKPAPEIFLRTAKGLGVNPSQCLVLEDSPHGIKGAKAAGMTVVAVLTPLTRNLDLSLADYRIDSLTNFDFSILDGN